MKLIITFLISILIFGCSLNTLVKNNEKDKSEALTIIKQLRKQLENKNYEEAKKLFHPDFFKITSEDKLSKIFDQRLEHLGNYIDSEILHWETNVKKGTDPISEYTFILKSKFSKQSVQQQIGLKKDQNDNILIFGYYLALPKK